MTTSTSSGTRVFETAAGRGAGAGAAPCARAGMLPAPATSNVTMTSDLNVFTVVSSFEPGDLQRLNRQWLNLQRRRRERFFSVVSGPHQQRQPVLLNRQQQLLERSPFVLGNHDLRRTGDN